MSEELERQWQTEFLLMQKDLAHMVENQEKTNRLYSQSIEELKESSKETSACIRELTNSNLQLRRALSMA
jgi:methyl-accepting chemotaxis protein